MAKIDNEKLMEVVKETTDKVAETVKEISENPQVKNAAKTAKKAAEKVTEAPQVKNAAASAKKAAEKVAETPQAKKASATAKKAVEAAKKEYTKLALKETYIQMFGAEYKESEILAKVEEAFKAEGHRVSSIKSLELYIKPEDGAAYYVINGGKFSGSVEL